MNPVKSRGSRAQAGRCAGERGRLTHLVGLNQMEVLPVNTEPMFKVPALLLTPGTEPVCKQRGPLSQLRGSRDRRGAQGCSSPRITFTLNLSLRRASSTLKLHFTSSYSAWGREVDLSRQPTRTSTELTYTTAPEPQAGPQHGSHSYSGVRTLAMTAVRSACTVTPGATWSTDTTVPHIWVQCELHATGHTV